MKVKIYYLWKNLEKNKIYLLSILAASLPFSESIKEIAIFLTSIILLMQIIRREGSLKWDFFHYGLTLLILAAFLTTLQAEFPRRSLDGLNDILFFAAPFFVAQSIQDGRNIRIIIWILGLATALAALIYMGKAIHLSRPLEIPSLGNQNYTAMFLIITISSLISLLCFSKKESLTDKVFLTITLLVLIVAAVMTVMRTSFLALGVFLLILFWQFKDNKWMRLFFFSLCSFTLLTVLLIESMRAKILITSSFYARLELWKYAFHLFRENLLLGVGLNNFKFTFPADSLIDAGVTYFDAHSLYFQTISQMGLLGMTALFLLIYGFFRRWFRLNSFSPHILILKYSALGAFCVIFIGGIFDTTLHHNQAIAFSLLTGFLFHYHDMENKKK